MLQLAEMSGFDEEDINLASGGSSKRPRIGQ